MGFGVWVLGFGFWGLGYWAKTPIPNPQSPSPIPNEIKKKIRKIHVNKY